MYVCGLYVHMSFILLKYMLFPFTDRGNLFKNNENLIVFLLLAKSQISLIVQGFNKGNSCFSFYLASVRDWTRSLRAGVAEVNVEHR